MTNELCKFEGGQACVIVLPLAGKAVHSLPLETLCPFNCPHKTLLAVNYIIFIHSSIHSAENARIDSFHARRRLIESSFDARISHNKHDKLFDITAN